MGRKCPGSVVFHGFHKGTNGHHGGVAKRAQFNPVKTSKGWRVNIPAGYSSTGQRQRIFYRTKKEAVDAGQTFRARRDEFGKQVVGISAAISEDAVIARDLLKPYGISLKDAAASVARVQEEAKQSEVVEKAVAEFLPTKEEISARQQKHYERATEAFQIEFAGRSLSEISERDLVRHAERVAIGPTSFNQRVRLLKAFWRWCAKRPRRWCDADTIEVLEPKPMKGGGEIGVLTSAQAEKLLRTAEDRYPQTVRGFALALFTGMRQAEIERLKPDDITREGIQVPKMSSKIRRRRFIQMTPALEAWLRAYPVQGTVLPSGWHRKQRAVRRLAGWKVWSDLVEPNSPNPDLPEWPLNALRHTHATVSVVMGQPLSKLSFEFGHSGGEQTLKAHYAGAMTKSDAEAIVALRPLGYPEEKTESTRPEEVKSSDVRKRRGRSMERDVELAECVNG